MTQSRSFSGVVLQFGFPGGTDVVEATSREQTREKLHLAAPLLGLWRAVGQYCPTRTQCEPNVT